MIASLWQALPQRQIGKIDIVLQSADRFANPNNQFGWNPNFALALNNHL
jgi:hypothetical protein